MIRLMGTAMALILAPAMALAGGAPERASDTWPMLSAQIWPDAEIADGDAMIRIDAPTRAEDAALVPFDVAMAPGNGRIVRSMTIIVEENPAPVAAEFTFSERMGREFRISTRLRVERYSNIRVVAELDDGSLIEAARYVKASGGCAAPAVKDAEAALASLGRMKLREFAGDELPAGMAEAQVMMRHPNNSGFQIDQVSLLHIPAFFVHEMAVTAEGEPLFTVTGGISLSEDPTIRFTYPETGARTLEVTAKDTDGGIYSNRFDLGNQS
ncbi:MAG: quinoprotein dehydrogenase-associated SoxYZ-like carrier [Pseudomonadota bacterium]